MDMVEAAQGHWNVYVCSECNEFNRDHRIEEVPAGPARNWGGAPSHYCVCSGCGARTGPWVKESDVHAGL